MENIPSDIRPLSTPSSYRLANPAVLPVAPVSEQTRASRRKRIVIGFSIAAALHAALVLGWWLSPPLRLKASYAPERWVQVLPVEKPAPPAALAPAEAAAPTAIENNAARPVRDATRKSRKTRSRVAPSLPPSEVH
jgi:hypothetical protein